MFDLKVEVWQDHSAHAVWRWQGVARVGDIGVHLDGPLPMLLGDLLTDCAIGGITLDVRRPLTDDDLPF